VHRLRFGLGLAAAAVALSGCGGSESGRHVDPSALLDSAFTHPISSSSVEADFKLEVEGVPQLSDPTTLSIDGPYVSGQGNQIPSFDWDVDASLGGFGLEGEVVSTGDNVYLSVFGDNYQVGRAPVARVNASVANLVINPREWFGKASYEGDEEVAGVETAHILARLRGDQLVEDVGALGEGLGLSSLTPVVNGKIEAWVGIDDEVVRELAVLARFTIPPDQRDRVRGATRGRVGFEIVQSDVGSEQEITIPEGGGFKPIGRLIESINDLASGVFALGLD
jgi:hypothetical protein